MWAGFCSSSVQVLYELLIWPLHANFGCPGHSFLFAHSFFLQPVLRPCQQSGTTREDKKPCVPAENRRWKIFIRCLIRLDAQPMAA